MQTFLVGLVVGFGVLPVALGQGAPDRVQFNTAGAGAKQQDIEGAVRLICPTGKITRGKDGKVSGCAVCPKGTDFYGQTQNQWEMYAETPGHFTSAKDDNLVLDGTGCDAHASNFGGSFVFALVGGSLRLLRYEKGLITNQCQKFVYADGRDGLVCRGGWSGQGEADQSVVIAAFDASGRATTRTLIRVTDTTGTCGEDKAQVVQQGGISEVQFVSKPGSGTADRPGESAQISGLRIEAELGAVKCSIVEATQKTKRAPATVKSYAIEFTFDGKQFKVAPGGRAALAKFSAQ